MNYIWPGMMLLALIAAAANGTLAETVTAGMTGAGAAVETVLGFAGGMCLWTGLLRVADAGGITALLRRLLRPLTKRLFPDLAPDGEAMEHIAMNMTANLLGMGNAATPAGIAAMQALDRLNPEPQRASPEMCTFVVINTASLQLIPTTVLAMRSAAGSADPYAILVPVWICSGIALTAAVGCMKIILRLSRRRCRT